MPLLILLLALLIIKPYFAGGFPYTHDGENHLARFANYKIAFKEGQFPPRFAPNLMNHYGYPVFNYNYPLANIISLPFSILKINYELSFKIIVFAFVLLGLIGSNLWLKDLGFKTRPRILALLGLGFSPYLTNAIVFRGNIGEIMAMGLFPWLLYLISRKSSAPKLPLLLHAALWAMFFLSHNLIAFFGTPILLSYAIFVHRRRLLKQTRLIMGFILGLGSSLWFWLPAFLEKNLIVLDGANLTKGFSDHFPTLGQLFFSPLEFGFSKIGSVDSLSFNLGALTIVSLLLTTIALCKRKLPHAQWFFLTLCLILVLGQLAFSAPLWQLLPFGHYIQFPWRLSLFLTVLALPLIAWAYTNLNYFARLLLVLGMIVQFHGSWLAKPADYFHRDIITYDVFSQSTSTANENLPQDFTFRYFADDNWQPTASILTGEGQVSVKTWRGSNREYHLSLKTPATITEPTANFAGWETTAGGNLVNYENSATIGGRIAYNLPPGEYDVVSRFTQNTSPRKIGNGLSLLSLLVLAILSILNYRNAKNR